MPFKDIDVSANARGGSELMRDRLIAGLKQRGRQDLLDHFDFHNSRVRDFDPSKQNILLLHDLPGDPESDHLIRDRGARFDQMVFVSNWQMQRYMLHYAMMGDKCTVIPNAIPVFWGDLETKWADNVRGLLGSEHHPIRLIYHTTPHRGLEIAVPVFQELYGEYLDKGIHLTLDVYSSFSIYGWSERDAPYRTLFDACKIHPAINYHGAVSNQEVRDALAESHIFLFPSMWPETSCLAMIEAMSAGCAVVHSNLAALPETSGGLTEQYPYCMDRDEHATRCYETMVKLLDRVTVGEDFEREGNVRLLKLNRQRTDAIHDEFIYVSQWVTLLDKLKNAVDS